jgi:hypothetical protein
MSRPAKLSRPLSVRVAGGALPATEICCAGVDTAKHDRGTGNATVEGSLHLYKIDRPRRFLSPTLWARGTIAGLC